MLDRVEERERTDDELIVEIARGRREALGLLYDRHAPTMFALASRMLRDASEAEDLLHDVFVEVWNRAGDFDPERGSVRTWLLVRVRSRSIDRKKSAAFSRRASLDDQPDARKPLAREAPDEGLDDRRLRAALDLLPPEQRGVLLLGYFEGLSSSEIAARLDIPLGTVKSRVGAAMAKLRSHFGAVVED